MKSKSINLYCASTPALFLLVIFFSGVAMVILWVVLFLQMAFILARGRKLFKNTCSQHKKGLIFLVALTSCFIGYLLIIASIVVVFPNFSDTYPLFFISCSLIFLIFYRKILLAGLVKKNIFKILILALLIIVLFFSSFVQISKFRDFQNEQKNRIKCLELCAPLDGWCQNVCISPGIGLGCGEGFKLY